MRPAAPPAIRWVAVHWRTSSSARLGLLGAGTLALITTVAIFAPVFAPHDPTALSGTTFAPPSRDHLLGTNDIGQDLLSELIFGARVSLLVGISAAALSTMIGAAVGIVAGFFGGATDTVLMRGVDVTLALPLLPLLIVLAAFFGRSITVTTLVIGLVIWARPARFIRAQVLSLRERGPVQSAIAMGAAPAHLLSRHLLPSVSPLLIAQLIRGATTAILLEASLAFLGLGDPTTKSWGTMLYYASARGAFLTDSWIWWVVPTGLAISAVVLAFAFVGYALEEWSDPRLRSRRLPVLGLGLIGATPWLVGDPAPSIGSEESS